MSDTTHTPDDALKDCMPLEASGRDIFPAFHASSANARSAIAVAYRDDIAEALVNRANLCADLLAALESAPEPQQWAALILTVPLGVDPAGPDGLPKQDDKRAIQYARWYDGPRAAAIAKARGKP